MGNVLRHFLEPLTKLYGEIDTDDADFVMGIYTHALEPFDDAALRAGFAKVASSFVPSKRIPWPSPGVCVKACKDGAEAQGSSADTADRYVHDMRRRMDASRQWAWQWIDITPLGRMARDEGWAREAAHEVRQMHFAASIKGAFVSMTDITLHPERVEHYRQQAARRAPQGGR